MFFEKFEQIILIFILVQFGALYCNHVLSCHIALDFFLLLIDQPTKTLSPGDWTHWSIFGPCNNALHFLSRTKDLQNLH